MYINIAKDFNNTPGGRYIHEGPNSGEEFRKKILKDNYLQAIKNNEKLVIDLDGCYGYPTSFLEEAFGGLARELKTRDFFKTIELISEDEPGLIALINKYVSEAEIKG